METVRGLRRVLTRSRSAVRERPPRRYWPGRLLCAVCRASIGFDLCTSHNRMITRFHSICCHCCYGRRNSCGLVRSSLAQLCENGHHAGIGQDGFYAPYAALDLRAVVHVPQKDRLIGFDLCTSHNRMITRFHSICCHCCYGRRNFYAPYAALDLRALVHVPEGPSP
jgi:hypothetical protein